MNNQCRSQYCRYEINLPPAVHRVMLLQENQCWPPLRHPAPLRPLLFSGAGQGVRTSALIIQMLTLLSESEPERERGRERGWEIERQWKEGERDRERLRRNSRQGCLSKLYQTSPLSDVRHQTVGQPAVLGALQPRRNPGTCRRGKIIFRDKDVRQ